MGRGELRRDQHTILVQAGRMRSAGTGAAKPNAIVREVQALYLSAGFGDFGIGDLCTSMEDIKYLKTKYLLPIKLITKLTFKTLNFGEIHENIEYF